MNNVFITDPFKADIQRIKNTLYTKFKINDLDFYAYYFDMIIFRDRVNRTLRLKQLIYIKRFFKQHDI